MKQVFLNWFVATQKWFREMLLIGLWFHVQFLLKYFKIFIFIVKMLDNYFAGHTVQPFKTSFERLERWSCEWTKR